MRPPNRWAWSAAVLGGIVATVPSLVAQQYGSGGGAGSGGGSTAGLDPAIASRSARHLMRNGLDYLDRYGDPERAIQYLRAAALKQSELTDLEKSKLKDAYDRAMAVLSQGADVASQGGRRTAPLVTRPLTNRPAAPTNMARRETSYPPRDLLQRATASDLPPLPRDTAVIPSELATEDEIPTGRGSTRPERVPVEEASPEAPAAPLPSARANPAEDLPKTGVEAETEAPPVPIRVEAPAVEAPGVIPTPVGEAEAVASRPAKPIEPAPAEPVARNDEEYLDSLPVPTADELEAKRAPKSSERPATTPDPATNAPPPLPLPADSVAPKAGTNPPTPSGEAEPPVRESAASEEGDELPPLPMPAEAGAEPLPPRALEPSTARVADARDLERPATSPGEVPVETPIVETPANPALPTEAEAGSTPAPPANPAEEASGTDELPPLPGSIVPPDAVAPGRADGAETQGGSELDDLPPLPEEATGAAGLTRRVEGRPRIELVTPEHTTLQPETLREVMDIARQQEEADRARIRQDPTERLPFMSEELDATQTQTDQLTRAPSPTEARPIRPIAVPEDFVPIDQRRWSPTRKYWAAAATCHTPLYFQDAVLERYGQGVEQALGPHWGRFFSYPLDDPRESVQRNQVLQPFYSTGKLALQIVAWPYNLIMDPPWESHYDLGYYRPGDQIPPDMTYLPHTGLGPPLRGAKY